jgi:hypothetical protein
MRAIQQDAGIIGRTAKGTVPQFADFLVEIEDSPVSRVQPHSSRVHESLPA